jgi:hypothetical protein
MNDVHSTQMAKNTAWNDRKKTECTEKRGIILNEDGINLNR